MKEVWLTPELIAAVAVLVTAITGLIVALRGQKVVAATKDAVVATQSHVAENAAVLDTVLQQTNGTAHAIQDRIAKLEVLVLDLHKNDAILPSTPGTTAPTAQPTVTST